MKTYDLEQILIATITDIPQYVTQLLEQYDKYNPWRQTCLMRAHPSFTTPFFFYLQTFIL